MLLPCARAPDRRGWSPSSQHPSRSGLPFQRSSSVISIGIRSGSSASSPCPPWTWVEWRTRRSPTTRAIARIPSRRRRSLPQRSAAANPVAPTPRPVIRIRSPTAPAHVSMRRLGIRVRIIGPTVSAVRTGAREFARTPRASSFRGRRLWCSPFPRRSPIHRARSGALHRNSRSVRLPDSGSAGRRFAVLPAPRVRASRCGRSPAPMRFTLSRR